MAARAFAALVALAAFVGSGAYVVAHPKNAAAPLQPPAASEVAQATARPAPTPTARGSARRGTATPPAKITLQPGVRATELPGIAFTHVS